MKKILLTGDTPTGKLHLGHLVGSIENRIRLQDEYDCYYIIANKHAFTTNAANPAAIRDSVMQVATDWLAAGIDPSKSAMFIQSEVPAIDELTFSFRCCCRSIACCATRHSRASCATRISGRTTRLGFRCTPSAKLPTSCRSAPISCRLGEDQLAHLEMTREVVRRFNQLYCGVDPEAPDEDQVALGGLFPMVKPLLGRVKRLVGIGAPGPDGQLVKMSKSLNNAIYLSDSADEVARKVKSMYTDPKRIRATESRNGRKQSALDLSRRVQPPTPPGSKSKKDLYRRGMVGDKQIKERLTDVLNDLLEPIRTRRAEYERNPADVLDALRAGTIRAIEVTEATVDLAKEKMQQHFFDRSLKLV